jgi:hypothetical protein
MTETNNMKDNDILESEEFNELLETFRNVEWVAKEEKQKVKDFIRANFDQKEVEEPVEATIHSLSKRVDGTFVILPVKLNPDIHPETFTGTEAECEAEKARLEANTKDFYCSAYEIERCDKQCAECAVDEKSKPAPQPFTREELIEVATAAMNGMLANSIDMNQGTQPRWKLGARDLARDAVEYATALLTEINKVTNK